MTSVEVTQTVAEVWVSSPTPPKIWDTQIAAEVWSSVYPAHQIWNTQDCVEIWVTKRRLGVTYAVYPTLASLGYSVFWIPQFANAPTQVAANKAEIDLALAATPIHDFELTYNVLRNNVADHEFKTLFGFFLLQGGNVGRFLFLNPDDYTVTGQVQYTTDGTTLTYGPLNRTFGYGANVGTEAVGYIDNSATFNVYLDGVLESPGNYTLDRTYPCNQRITWAVAPTTGKVITTDMTYWYYVKFQEDNMSFEKFMSTLWTVKKVSLRSCRVNS